MVKAGWWYTLEGKSPRELLSQAAVAVRFRFSVRVKSQKLRLV
jgi:hypothetical protein